MKLCTRCKRSRPREEFRLNPKMRDGLGSWCRRCSVERTRQWRADNRVAYNSRARQRYAKKAARP
jgi:hypothetical protein